MTKTCDSDGCTKPAKVSLNRRCLCMGHLRESLRTTQEGVVVPLLESRAGPQAEPSAQAVTIADAVCETCLFSDNPSAPRDEVAEAVLAVLIGREPSFPSRKPQAEPSPPWACPGAGGTKPLNTFNPDPQADPR